MVCINNVDGDYVYVTIERMKMRMKMKSEMDWGVQIGSWGGSGIIHRLRRLFGSRVVLRILGLL